MFDGIYTIILEMSREAWVFVAGLLVIIALLGGLYYVLQGSAGAAFGGSKATAGAIIGAIGLIIIVMFAFLILPALGSTLTELQPPAPF